MRRRGRYVPITLGLLGAACSTPLEPQDDLAIAQRRWQAAAIADYSFTFQRSCFCTTFEARYDAQLGYPAEVSIDYLTNALDDELSLRIAGFRITGGMNAAWHAKHQMPPRATREQRIAWHLAHAKHCACRPVPPTLRAEVRARRARADNARY